MSSSPTTNNNGLSTSAKQADAVSLLLKQTIAPAQLIQVKKGGDIMKRKKRTQRFLRIFIFMKVRNVDLS
jgi:hypothetical protein